MQVPTLSQVYDTLLTGDTLVAPDNSVSISLLNARSRALTSVIIKAIEGSTPDALLNNDEFIQALENAHSDPKDPAQNIRTAQAKSEHSPERLWTLYKMTARGFGGLNTDHTNPFEFDIDNKNWILEGQNGTGKSSITNAILFALTGKIYRDQIGIINKPASTEPVYDNLGNKIADWPHIATYPTTWDKTNPGIEVSVALKFYDHNQRETATVERTLSGPAQELTETLQDTCLLTEDS